ncbi:MAG TPA: hypothetical protein H9674_05480 [Firmicutes bacterium]|nr:hypothetical protein [Bacillota bacterium]
MAGNRGTEAYDLSLFEPRPAKIVELKPNKKMLKAQRKKAKIQAVLNTAATLSVAAITVTVLGLMLASRVRMTELDTVINAREERLVELQSEEARLTDELGRMVSTESVENYAQNTLGMQKMESYQIEYIQVGSGDKVEMAEEEAGSILESIGSAISNFFAQLTYLFE